MRAGAARIPQRATTIVRIGRIGAVPQSKIQNLKSKISPRVTIKASKKKGGRVDARPPGTARRSYSAGSEAGAGTTGFGFTSRLVVRARLRGGRIPNSTSLSLFGP